MIKTIAQQLNEQVHNLDLGTGVPNGNQQEVSEMTTMLENNETMNENEIIGAIQPVTINPVPDTINNTPLLIDVDTKPTTKENAMENNEKDTTTTKATNNTTKETKTMGKTNGKSTRWAWQDDMAKAGEIEDANKARELITMHVSGTTGNLCREVAAMKPNKDRDLFCIWAAKMYGYDFGNTNRSRIYYRLIKNNDSLYNKIVADTASELPIGQKIEVIALKTTDIMGKVMGSFIGAGVAAMGSAVAVGVMASYQSATEIERAILQSKVARELDPQLVQLKMMWAQIQAAKSMAKDAQDKPEVVANDTSKA